MGHAKAEETPSICYKTHVQNIGWQGEKSDGEEAGTQGKSLRLEALQINLNNMPYSGGITYRTHIQNIGWENKWKSNGEISGTLGKSLRLEAVQIKLTGDMAEHYDVYYRVHAQNFGWLGWAKNGSKAGTEGYAYRLEAIQIELVEKNGKAPGRTTGAFKPMLQYQTHIQNIGDAQGRVNESLMAGTSGRALRLEGVRINVVNRDYEGEGGIRYKTHVQNIGWQDWKKDGELSGTSGRSLRLEAIQIELTGDMAKNYDVYYRVHAQNFGNLGWAKNGQSAGTQGYADRLEGLWIQLVPKGAAAPGSTANAFRQYIAPRNNSNTRTTSQAAKGTYVINTKSHIFHRLSCPDAKRMRHNRATFTGTRSALLAKYKGYRPCKVCKP